MGYQTGHVGPITYHQDNSGSITPISTTVVYTPIQFGAPPAAQIIPGLTQHGISFCRDNPQVEGPYITAENITWQVNTQPADNGLFGHHSGCVDITTEFYWWTWTADAGEEEVVPSEEGAAGTLNIEWK